MSHLSIVYALPLSIFCLGRKEYRDALRRQGADGDTKDTQDGDSPEHEDKDVAAIAIPDPYLSPSSAGTHRRAHRYAQRHGETPIYDGRQPLVDSLGPSAALYHPVFAYMRHAFSSDANLSKVELDDDIERLVYRLRKKLSRHNIKDEEKLMKAVEKYLKLLFENLDVVSKHRVPGKAVLDLVVRCHTPCGVDANVVVMEGKLGPGSGGSAPTQCLYGYRCESAHERVSQQKIHSRLFSNVYRCISTTPFSTRRAVCASWSLWSAHPYT